MIEDKKLTLLEDHISHLASLLMHAFKLPSFELNFDHTLYHHGECYATRKINIRLTSRDMKRLLSNKTVIDTLCHELAHLLEMNHGPHHKRLLIAMLIWLERNGY